MSERMLALTFLPNLFVAILLCPLPWDVMMVGCACFGLVWGLVMSDVAECFGWEDEV